MQQPKTGVSRGITLRAVLTEYIARRDLKEKTRKYYTYLIRTYLEDWLDLSVEDITRDDIEERHRFISERPRCTSGAQANLIMRILRSLLNYAKHRYKTSEAPLIKENPVAVLGDCKLWNRDRVRRTVLQAHQIRPWFEAVISLRRSTTRDILPFLLLTGSRKAEALRLRWAKVDFAGRWFEIDDTKNGEPHILPMTDFIFELLLERRRRASGDDEFVFAGRRNGTHLRENREFSRTVTKRSGVRFSPHDLRRTTLSIGNRLGLSVYTLKRIANHRNYRDVTSRYIVLDLEDLREPLQKIEDEILRLAGLR